MTIAIGPKPVRAGWTGDLRSGAGRRPFIPGDQSRRLRPRSPIRPTRPIAPHGKPLDLRTGAGAGAGSATGSTVAGTGATARSLAATAVLSAGTATASFVSTAFSAATLS